MSSLRVKLYTLLNGKLVGRDEFGNKYYHKAPINKEKDERWVLYRGIDDPSKIPARWYRWIHFMSDTIPTDENYKNYSWQIDHQANFTGTEYSYKQKNLDQITTDKTNKQKLYRKDYDAWSPKKQQN